MEFLVVIMLVAFWNAPSETAVFLGWLIAGVAAIGIVSMFPVFFGMVALIGGTIFAIGMVGYCFWKGIPESYSRLKEQFAPVDVDPDEVMFEK